MKIRFKKGNTQYAQGSDRLASKGAGTNAALRWAARLALVALIMGWLVSPVSAETVRYFNATVTPGSVDAGTANPLSFTILNCNGSVACEGSTTTASQSIKSMTIAIPVGFTVSPETCSVSAGAGDIWNVTFVAGVIQIVKQSSTELDPGESLTLTCTATAPCETGFYEWTSAAFNGADFTTAYVRRGPQPVVEVTGSCEPPGEFEEGDYCSYTQGGWGAPPNGGNPGMILADNFDSLYIDLVVGSGFTMTFESAPDVEEYLPAGGTPGALAGDVLNPTSTSAGVFGAQVTALRLNVDLNDAGIIDGFEGTISGLVLQNTGTSLDGMTVAQVLAVAEQALGGGGTPPDYSISDLNDLVTNLNEAFDNCVPTGWAIDHLVAPPG